MATMPPVEHVAFPRQGTVHAGRPDESRTLCGRRRRWLRVTPDALTCRLCQRIIARAEADERRVAAVLGRP